MQLNLSIDIMTVIILIILGNLFSAIIGFSYMVQHKRDSVIYIFISARLFEAFAWVALLLQGFMYAAACILIGNTFLILANIMQIFSFLKIKNRYNNSIRRGYFAVAVISILLFFIYTLVYAASGGIRIAIMSALMVAMWSYPVYVLLKDKNASFLQRVVGCLYVVELVFLAARAYEGLIFDTSMSLLSTNPYNVLFFFGLYLIMLTGNIGFILMAKGKTDLELMKAAKYDELTDIFNRREFLMRARKTVSLYARKKEPISFLMLDLDHFKKVNDVYGHTAGDWVLKAFAGMLKRELGPHNLFGRLGGEEFAVVLPGTSEEEALKIANRLREMAENESVSVGSDTEIKYTVSIGSVTTIPNDSTSADTLYKAGDEALYTAKMKGRNRVESFMM